MKKILSPMLLVLTVFVLLTSCSKEKDTEEGYTIGKVPYTFEHAYHQSVVKELTQYAKDKYGAKIVVVDGEASSEKTLAAVESLISQKVDGIALHTGDAGLMTTAIKLSHKAGIPIVTTFIRPTEKLAPHIQAMETPASFEIGVTAAEQWVKAHPDKPIIVAVLDFGGFEQIDELRTDPFMAGVKSVAPNATLVSKLSGEGASEASMKATLDILQANPDVNIIFGANDDMALGALAACEQLGRGKMNNGVPITEIIASVDASSPAIMKIYDPSSSLKLTHGAVRDNARAEADTLINIIEGRQAMDVYLETEVTSVPIDFWNTPIEDAQQFLKDNFFYMGNLEEDVKSNMKK